MASLTLAATYGLTLTLTSTEDSASIEFVPAAGIVLELAEIIVTGGAGVSGPDIYAFAAAYG